MPRKKNNISNNDKNNKTNSRKANSKHKLSDADKKELDDKIMKTEIETLNKEIVYYKQKISELKSKLKTAYINDVFENKVIRAIHEKNIILEPLKPVYINTSNKKKDKEVVVLNLSDIHFGERVNKEEMGGLNEYDMDIARQRIERLTKGVISIINILSNSYKLDELRIYGLGDFISGLIHTELVETADGDLVDWLYIGADIISRMILEFARYFKKITFIGIVGNHGEIRRNNKKVFKRKYVNWDYIIYKNIEFMCQKNKRIKFIIPKSFFYIDQIFDYRFLLLHGDNIRCFTPETKVLMSDYTPKMIKDVSIDDEIITIDGTKRKVVNKFEYQYSGEIVKINAYGLINDGIHATLTHKFPVIKFHRISTIDDLENLEPEDIDAGHLSAGDFLLVPPVPEQSIINELKVSDFVDSKIIESQRKHKIPEVITDLDSLGYIIGQYLADGNTNNNKQTIEIAYNSDEHEFWEDYIKACKSVFNKEPYLVNRKDMTVRAQRVLLHNIAAGNLIEALAGKYSDHKKLHPIIMQFPKSAKKQLLIGYLRGDGHTFRHQYRIKYMKTSYKDAVYRVVATSNSENLIYTLYWLSRSIGYTPYINTITKSGKRTWSISFYGKDALDLGPVTQRELNGRYIEPKDIKKNRPILFTTKDGKTYVRISKIKRENYNGKVYDLEIENKHYYVINNVVTHNSWMGIPWYGIQRAVKNFHELLASRREYIDYVILGHFHNTGSLQTVSGEILINGCFLPNENVIMADGRRKRIIDVKENDYVINIKGERKRVKETLSYDYNGNIVNFQVSGIREAIKCTPNHELYVIKGSQLANKVKSGERSIHVVHHANLNSDVKITPKWIPAEYISPGDYILIPDITEESISERLKPYKEDFYRMIGLYLAKGSIAGADNKLHHITFTFNINEENLAEFVIKTIKKYFNYEPSQLIRKQKTIREVVINRTEISKFIYSLAHRRCDQKYLSEDLMYIPRKYKLEILLGWILGDGHIAKQINNKSGYIVSGVTVGNQMAWQLRQLAVDCGFNPTVTSYRSKTHPSHKLKHTIVFSNTDSIILYNLMEDKSNKPKWKNIQQIGFINAIKVNGKLYRKIKQVWTTHYEGKVYDLSIDSDDKELGHSYMINGVAVHNSVIGGDEFSLGSMVAASKPYQLLFGVHKNKGITFRYNMKLSD